MSETGNRRSNFGWCMYDWANSAYTTTIAVGVLPVYFAQAVVGPEGVRLGDTLYRATTLWGFTAGLAAFLAFLMAPTLGAVADMTASKKRFLLACAYTGSLFTVLLYFCQSGDVFRTLCFFLIAQVAYVGGNVFYDAFLPQIAQDRNTMDRLSGKGYAYGYVGGGIQFALALGLLAGHRQLGLAQGLAARLGMVMAGLWWAGFTLLTARHLSEAPAAGNPLPPAALAAAMAGRPGRRLFPHPPDRPPGPPLSPPGDLPVGLHVLQRRDSDHHQHGHHLRQGRAGTEHDRPHGHPADDPDRGHRGGAPVQSSGCMDGNPAGGHADPGDLVGGGGGGLFRSKRPGNSSPWGWWWVWSWAGPRL